MPANLPPQYVSAEQKLKSARDPEEKIAILEEMWSLLPKHKGTDKNQADIKRRISKLKAEAKKSSSRKKGFSVTVIREGAGQIVALGPPNSGKSSVVSLLTGIELKAAPYPFTTVSPAPAMMPYLDASVQLLDMPPLAEGHLEFWAINMIRNADAALLVVDVSGEDSLRGLDWIFSELDRRVTHLGREQDGSEKPSGYTAKETLLVANKMDCDGSNEKIALLHDLYEGRFDIFPFSCVSASDEDAQELRTRIFALLGMIRIYSKQPGKKPDLTQPFTIRSGSTVLEFAEHVHKDFARGLKQARIWGSARFDGQAVRRDYVLRDGDVVELSV